MRDPPTDWFGILFVCLMSNYNLFHLFEVLQKVKILKRFFEKQIVYFVGLISKRILFSKLNVTNTIVFCLLVLLVF